MMLPSEELEAKAKDVRDRWKKFRTGYFSVPCGRACVAALEEAIEGELPWIVENHPKLVGYNTWS